MTSQHPSEYEIVDKNHFLARISYTFDEMEKNPIILYKHEFKLTFISLKKDINPTTIRNIVNVLTKIMNAHDDNMEYKLELAHNITCIAHESNIELPIQFVDIIKRHMVSITPSEYIDRMRYLTIGISHSSLRDKILMSFLNPMEDSYFIKESAAIITFILKNDKSISKKIISDKSTAVYTEWLLNLRDIIAQFNKKRNDILNILLENLSNHIIPMQNKLLTR